MQGVDRVAARSAATSELTLLVCSNNAQHLVRHVQVAELVCSENGIYMLC